MTMMANEFISNADEVEFGFKYSLTGKVIFVNADNDYCGNMSDLVISDPYVVRASPSL